MSISTVRLISGLILIFHGVGYVLAYMPALNIVDSDSWHHHSWLLSGLLGDTASRIVVILLFGIPMIGFIAAGLGVFGIVIPHDWWQTLAIVSAIVGLAALALFWNAFPALFPNKIGATVVNVLVLWVLLGSSTLSTMVADI